MLFQDCSWSWFLGIEELHNPRYQRFCLGGVQEWKFTFPGCVLRLSKNPSDNSKPVFWLMIRDCGKLVTVFDQMKYPH